MAVLAIGAFSEIKFPFLYKRTHADPAHSTATETQWEHGADCILNCNVPNTWDVLNLWRIFTSKIRANHALSTIPQEI